MSPQPMPSARISMSLCSLWKSSTIAFTAARVAGFGSVSHIVTAIFFWAVARRGAATTAAPAASVVRNSRRPSVPSFRSVTSRWRPAVSRRPMVVLLVATPSGAAVGRHLTRGLELVCRPRGARRRAVACHSCHEWISLTVWRGVVRGLRPHPSGARSPDSIVDLRAAGFPPAHAGGLPASGSARQPDRAGPRRGAAAADRAPVPQPARDVVPAGPRASVRGEPHQAPHQDPQALLGRRGPGPAHGRRGRAHRRSPREPCPARPALLARRAGRALRDPLLSDGGGRGGGLRRRGRPPARPDRGQGHATPAPARRRAAARFPRPVWQGGARGAPAAHRLHARVARPRRPRPPLAAGVPQPTTPGAPTPSPPAPPPPAADGALPTGGDS